MYPRLSATLLRWLRVPAEPHPPHGDPASLRVFRAGRNFLKLRLLKWAVAQVAALGGIIFWFGFFSNLEGMVEDKREKPYPAAAVVAPAETSDGSVAPAAPAPSGEQPRAKRVKYRGTAKVSFDAWQHGTAEFLAKLPSFAMVAIWFFEIAGVVFYVLQLPFTFLLARLDYDLRWYMVTDRSLRLRHGVWKINESTMSFANIQQVVVSQGPLQRFLGLYDLKVQSAGGGLGEDDHHGNSEDDMHLGLFHSVENASEIRDLILDRLRHFRESGLGDPDEKRAFAVVPTPTGERAAPADSLAAARELLAEVKALRATLT